jgi:hypothetical protein
MRNAIKIEISACVPNIESAEVGRKQKLMVHIMTSYLLSARRRSHSSGGLGGAR